MLDRIALTDDGRARAVSKGNWYLTCPLVRALDGRLDARSAFDFGWDDGFFEGVAGVHATRCVRFFAVRVFLWVLALR